MRSGVLQSEVATAAHAARAAQEAARWSSVAEMLFNLPPAVLPDLKAAGDASTRAERFMRQSQVLTAILGLRGHDRGAITHATRQAIATTGVTDGHAVWKDIL